MNLWIADLNSVSVVRVDEFYTAWPTGDFLGPYTSIYDAQAALVRYVRMVEGKANELERQKWGDDPDAPAFGWLPT